MFRQPVGVSASSKLDSLMTRRCSSECERESSMKRKQSGIAVVVSPIDQKRKAPKDRGRVGEGPKSARSYLFEALSVTRWTSEKSGARAGGIAGRTFQSLIEPVTAFADGAMRAPQPKSIRMKYVNHCGLGRVPGAATLHEMAAIPTCSSLSRQGIEIDECL